MLQEKILTAASALFLDVGYEAVTMDGIVAKSGAAKRTLYRWWPTKPAVIADAILGGYLDVPSEPIRYTGDIWADIRAWLEVVSVATQGPYGDILRASTAIGAIDPLLGEQLTEAFARPAYAAIHARLSEALKIGQIAESADLAATIDLLMSVIVYVGNTRQEVERISAVVAILKHGIST